MALLALCLIASAILVTTSCSGFGKDDFYGTWTATYSYPTNQTDFDSTYPATSGVQTIAYASEKAGRDTTVTMYFSGTSEDLLKSTGASFWQEKISTKNSATVVHTFYMGTYKLNDNGGVTTGNLTLTYQAGYDMTKGSKTLDELVAMSAADLVALKSTDAAVDDAPENYDGANPDVEEFSFALTDKDFFKGYQSMSASAISECTWEVPYRNFTLNSENSDTSVNE